MFQAVRVFLNLVLFVFCSMLAMTHLANAGTSPLQKVCQEQNLNAAEIVLKFNENGWLLAAPTDFKKLFNMMFDLRVLTIVALEGLPDGTVLEQRKIFNEHRDYHFKNTAFQIVQDLENPGAKKYYNIYLKHKKTSSWIAFSKYKSELTCEWYGENNDDFNVLRPIHHPCEKGLEPEYSNVFCNQDPIIKTNKSFLVTVNTIKFKELLGYTPHFSAYHKIIHADSAKDQ